MKKILIIIFILTEVVGCHKSNSNSPSGSLETSFIFTINGKTDTIIGSQDVTSEGTVIRRKYLMGSIYYYVLGGTKYITQPDNFFELYILILTPNLKEGSYTYNYATLPQDNSSWSSGQSSSNEIDSPDFGSFDDYGSFKATDQTIIVITKIHDGYADGTYSAPQLSLKNTCSPCPASTCSTCPSTIQVTNGVFKNVKIIEQ